MHPTWIALVLLYLLTLLTLLCRPTHVSAPLGFRRCEKKAVLTEN
jgi:hypothetical protein